VTEVSESVDKPADTRNALKTKRLAGIAESLREVKAHRRGEVVLQTLDEFLKELD
jgi:hypothetical protein